jgi:hypothetical protein
VGDTKDKKTGIPVISLYGNHKKPTADDFKSVDVLVFDIQDVGLRYYTYISSLEEYMNAAFENSKQTIRTTPIGQGGAKFLDKSDLWAAEGQVNISDAFDFSDVIEVMAGLQWKQWVMN